MLLTPRRLSRFRPKSASFLSSPLSPSTWGAAGRLVRDLSTSTPAEVAEEVDVVIVGAGLTGMSLSYLLSLQGRSHVILEKAPEPGWLWKNGVWDNFRLATPTWSMQLPGMGDNMESNGYMSKEELIEQLTDYHEKHMLPIRCDHEVTRVSMEEGRRRSDDRFVVHTNQGVFCTPDLVMCTGIAQNPRIPSVSKSLPGHLQQLHSATYKNPEQVGQRVLVVGSGQSGCEISRELVEAGKTVFFSLGSSPAHVPTTYRGKHNMEWMNQLGMLQRSVDDPLEPEMPLISELRSFSGGSSCLSDDDSPFRTLATKGAVLLGRLEEDQQAAHMGLHFQGDVQALVRSADLPGQDFRDRMDHLITIDAMEKHFPRAPGPTIAPDLPQASIRHNGLLSLEEIDAVVWATGYEKTSFPMLRDLPRQDDMWDTDVEGEYPAVSKCASTVHPGLHFLGLRWLQTAASALFMGVGYDAGRVARRIHEHRGYPLMPLDPADQDYYDESEGEDESGSEGENDYHDDDDDEAMQAEMAKELKDYERTGGQRDLSTKSAKYGQFADFDTQEAAMLKKARKKQTVQEKKKKDIYYRTKQSKRIKPLDVGSFSGKEEAPKETGTVDMRKLFAKDIAEAHRDMEAQQLQDDLLAGIAPRDGPDAEAAAAFAHLQAPHTGSAGRSPKWGQAARGRPSPGGKGKGKGKGKPSRGSRSKR